MVIMETVTLIHHIIHTQRISRIQQASKNGQYLDLTIDTAADENTTGGLYISQEYVKDENGQSYVYKEENGKLVKQKVKTGKSLWGSYIEIKSGITESDYIAFPYGVSEGEKVKESDDIAY